MFLKRCLLAASTVTAFASLALTDAKSALAITFYDFQVNWSDGTTGNGSFSFNETAPTGTQPYGGSYGSSYKQWINSFLDFNFTSAGKTYTKTDLLFSNFVDHTFPTTSFDHLSYGDFSQYFHFELPNLYVAGYDYAPNGSFSDGVYGENYSSETYVSVTSGSFQQRAQAVPTPALLPGLIGMSVVALRKRKDESSKEVLEPAEV